MNTSELMLSVTVADFVVQAKKNKKVMLMYANALMFYPNEIKVAHFEVRNSWVI